MSPWLTGRSGQFLAVLTSFLAVFLVWFAVLAPVLDWFADRQIRIEQRLHVLSHTEALVASLPSLRAAVKNQSSAAGSETMLLPGDSDAVAAARLQEQVQAMAAASGLVLATVETLPVAVKGDWHKISLRVTCNAPWPVLIGLIRATERASTRIFIGDIHFNSSAVVARPVILPIQTSLLVYGFRLASRKPGA